ncbi:MAG TPA: sodium:solute symporter [Bacteroidia bacterium]|nr:sodium:solute symporter [Bacteroidia bacterium]
MRPLDLIVLLGTLGFIVIYGAIKTRSQKDLDGYLRSSGEKKWWAICLSIIATQASAITFMSTPGQAYESGMGFLQIYFGLPLAMIVISAVFIPAYYRLNVYTAYEYLEGRFNLATRQFIALLFLISRGLGGGLTLYAPAIILSTILGWNLNWLCLLLGIAVILYIYVGGEKAVSQTQMLQMLVILSGMAIALVMLIKYLPSGVSLKDATYLAGKMGKMKVVSTGFSFSERYNIWTGLLGGFFLSLSYFGTDQSQVSRYLGGASVNESKMGLFFNGIVKIPMQFFILFIGVMTYVFFMFHSSPVFFNNKVLEKAALSTEVKQQLADKEKQHNLIEVQRNKVAIEVIHARNTSLESSYLDTLRNLEQKDTALRADVKRIIHKNAPDVETRDTDYVFLTFVLNHMPVGLIGLLLAVMFCAAMSSTAGQISSLASTTVVDYYKRSINKNGTEKHYVNASKVSTLIWGGITILFAISASQFDNLIQAVNELGSIFYGTILGVFVVAFFFKSIKGRAIFPAAIVSEIIIVILSLKPTFVPFTYINKMSFLWYNPIGVILVVGFSYFFTAILKDKEVSGKV